ncbi:hypothetical protein V6N13_108318 [Hibiscus sabdariffa]
MTNENHSSGLTAGGNHSGVLYGFHDGQPPGKGDSLGHVVMLERPVSPTAMDNPRAAKGGKNSADEKPSEMTSTTRQFDEFGGRPPDGCPVISPLVPLERPPSPMLLEEQSVGKKARNGVDVATFSDKVDMDADHESDVVCDVRDSAVRNPPLSQE